MANSSECGKEPSGSIKCGEFKVLDFQEGLCCMK